MASSSRYHSNSMGIQGVLEEERMEREAFLSDSRKKSISFADWVELKQEKSRNEDRHRSREMRNIFGEDSVDEIARVTREKKQQNDEQVMLAKKEELFARAEKKYKKWREHYQKERLVEDNPENYKAPKPGVSLKHLRKQQPQQDDDRRWRRHHHVTSSSSSLATVDHVMQPSGCRKRCHRGSSVVQPTASSRRHRNKPSSGASSSYNSPTDYLTFLASRR